MGYTAEKANDRMSREGNDQSLKIKIQNFFEEYKETDVYKGLVETFFLNGKFDDTFKTFVPKEESNTKLLRLAGLAYSDVIRRDKSGTKYMELASALTKLDPTSGVGPLFCRDSVMPKIQSNDISVVQAYEITEFFFTIKLPDGTTGMGNYFLEALLGSFSDEKDGGLKTLINADFSDGNANQSVKNVLAEAFEIGATNYKKDRPNVFIDPFEVKGTLAAKPNVKKMKANVVNVFPSSFLNQKMPLVPYVQVEFKTRLDQENILYDDPRLWQSITYNPNSHFVSMDLDDNKGVKRLTLNLFDKTYTELENIIAKTVMITNLKMEPGKETTTTSGSITFVFSKSAFTNMRIRFGYQTKDIKDNAFKDRVKDASLPVYKTDWLYFQMLSFKQEANDAGMNFTISAISSGGNSFENIKLLKKFAVIKGTPSKIISSFTNVLTDTFSKAGYKKEEGPIYIVPFIKNLDPLKVSSSINMENEAYSQSPWDLRLIEVPLGEKPRIDKSGNAINEYKTFKEVLDDLCSKVSPLYLADDGTVKQIVEGQSKEDMKLMNFTYTITELDIDTTINGKQTRIKQNKIRFYYSNPDKMFDKEGVKVRNYYWKNYGATVVKSLNVSTETDFAQMNMPIFNYSSDGGSTIQSISYSNVSKDAEGNIAESSSSITNLSAETMSTETMLHDNNTLSKSIYKSNFRVAIDDILKSDDFTFSARAVMPSLSGTTSPNKLAEMYMYQYAVNVNSSIFRGTIDILGDPFYLFDDALAPYSYLIRIVVLRPSEFKINYNENEPEKNQKAMSYLSGFYVITNIKHTIGESGYTTTLEVMKWPTAYEIPFSKDPQTDIS